MMDIEYSKIKPEIDLCLRNASKINFKMLNLPRNQKTIIFDIENTLITNLDVKNMEELEDIKKLSKNCKEDYIFID